MTAFILERKTPKQFRLEAAHDVKVTPKGYAFTPLRQTDPEAEKVREVMGALMTSAKLLQQRGTDLTLQRCIEHAQKSSYALLVEGVTFSSKQANGRPAMVVVR